MPTAGHDHPIETPVRRPPLTIGTTTATHTLTAHLVYLEKRPVSLPASQRDTVRDPSLSLSFDSRRWTGCQRSGTAGLGHLAGMRRWWLWVGVPVVLGIAAGAATTLLTDRDWGSELVARCVMFSAVYAVIRPAMLLRRSARGEERKPPTDNEDTSHDRRR